MDRTCAKCDQRPAGPGGILCPACVEAIEQANDERHVPMTTEQVLETAAREAPRWQGTLSRLADR